MENTLILGATGKTGRRIVRRLRASGHRVRTASRTGSDVAVDLGDPATWPAALDGATAVYLLEPVLQPVPDRDARIPKFVAEAVSAGVRRLVLLSAHGVGDAGDDHPLKSAERAVRESGTGWTILRPGWFAQNFSESFWRPWVLSGTLAVPTGDGRTPFVDAEDIAEVAADALTDGRHNGRIYQLTGPRAVSFAEAAELIGKATGRTIRHVDVTPEAFTERLASHGVHPDAARMLAGLLANIREDREAAVSDGVERALGRPAKPFEDYITEAAAAGHWN
ncbi:NAD(P)H-binding protein [Actinomadura sp. LD22]|uniref:NAD(P)H-binding protein n=1 Tax=Actinomadura physcomitrii TaxID=2650748 RepID=A0A6I4M3F5_9ACTN|nr:NAD(P)H-binding protein [Actinomadura physcomitrii]MWA00253.1 NAD(P)H-binding protein [Actinomadura physcomitrii]